MMGNPNQFGQNQMMGQNQLFIQFAKPMVVPGEQVNGNIMIYVNQPIYNSNTF